MRTGLPTPANAHARCPQLLWNRRPELADRHRHGVDAIVGEDHLGDARRHPFEEHEPFIGDDRFDRRTQRAVVDGVPSSSVRPASDRSVSTSTSTSNGCARSALLVQCAADAECPEAPQLDDVGCGHSPPTDSLRNRAAAATMSCPGPSCRDVMFSSRKMARGCSGRHADPDQVTGHQADETVVELLVVVEHLVAGVEQGLELGVDLAEEARVVLDRGERSVTPRHGEFVVVVEVVCRRDQADHRSEPLLVIGRPLAAAPAGDWRHSRRGARKRRACPASPNRNAAA